MINWRKFLRKANTCFVSDMAQVLHIITRSNDPLSREVIVKQGTQVDEVEVVDLSEGTPDYKQLAEKIFKADSVQVW